MELERNFKLKVSDDLNALNGEEFERFSRYILELVLNERVIHKGQNLFAKPVGYTALERMKAILMISKSR